MRGARLRWIARPEMGRKSLTDRASGAYHPFRHRTYPSGGLSVVRSRFVTKSTSRVAGPSPVTTRLNLCASCAATLPPKAQKCPACGASRVDDAVESVAPAPAPAQLGVGTGFRFGMGFAVGAVLIAALAWLGINTFLGSGGLPGFGSPVASTFSGTGSAKSESVHLAGDVNVLWMSRPSSAAACGHRALIRVASRPDDHEVIVDQRVLSETSGTHVLYGLVEADYLIEVDSTCEWSFRLRPRP